MNISHDKMCKFFDSAIKKTKDHSLLWKRACYCKVPVPERYDRERSFLSSYARGNLLLAFNMLNAKPECLINPAPDLPYQVIGEDDEDVAGMVLRLYNVVYDTLPTIESFMDAVINSTDDPDNSPC